MIDHTRSVPPYYIARTPKPAPVPKPRVPAMDAALHRSIVADAVMAMGQASADLDTAIVAVRPFVGDLGSMPDAESVYREALRQLGNPEADTIPVEALPHIFAAMPLPGMTPAQDRAIRDVRKQMAEDAAKPQPTFEERFPQMGRLLNR